MDEAVRLVQGIAVLCDIRARSEGTVMGARRAEPGRPGRILAGALVDPHFLTLLRPRQGFIDIGLDPEIFLTLEVRLGHSRHRKDRCRAITTVESAQLPRHPIASKRAWLDVIPATGVRKAAFEFPISEF
jgi:hypothetical protein